jgi:tryptophan synthase alpha chain
LNPDSIAQVFARARAEGRIALIGYLPSAWPDDTAFRTSAETAFAAGMDILEVGVPSPDPYLDGETIRRAVAESVKAGATSRSAVEAAAPLARSGRALVAMMYAVSYAELGGDLLSSSLAGLGYAGLLVVGADEATMAASARSARSAGISSIGFAGGRMDAAGLSSLAERSGGFIYLPSYEGKTGRRAVFGKELGERIALAKAASHGLPVAVGFGVNKPSDVAALRELGADGAIIGTAMVEASSSPERLAAYVSALRAAAEGRRP